MNAVFLGNEPKGHCLTLRLVLCWDWKGGADARNIHPIDDPNQSVAFYKQSSSVYIEKDETKPTDHF